MSGQRRDTYYAHTAEGAESGWQTLKDHLTGTAALAEAMSVPFCRELCRLAGLLHDAGKYRPEFQARLKGEEAQPVQHAYCGAQLVHELCRDNRAAELFGTVIEYAIAGHHGGLPDYGTAADNAALSTLSAKLKRPPADLGGWDEMSDAFDARSCPEVLSGMLGRFRAGLSDLPAASAKAQAYEAYDFLVRYVYSVLVDADRLDTETFAAGKPRSVPEADFDEAARRVTAALQSFSVDTPVAKARAALQQQARSAADKDAGIYLLDMPTGSGKTLCSLDIALRRLRRTGKRRIIYVIPYTSIIEQTAGVFRRLLGEESGSACLDILEHHSNFDFGLSDDEGEQAAGSRLKAAAENWDAPLIVTTAVQFFESIYCGRAGRMRKVHNMADSVLVFDEMHMLPVQYFRPCLTAVEQLTRLYGSEAIFLTATMPDFRALAEKFLGRAVPMTELVADRSRFADFYNCGLEYLGRCGDERLLSLAAQAGASLVIVNSRKRAQALFTQAGGRKFHLSTHMTPRHRTAVIDRIRAALYDGEPVTVVSTSLVEAGVDLDFAAVFRELAGAENILQAAGRCNREGKRTGCTTYVFETDGPVSREIGVKAEITRGCIATFGAAGLRQRECIEKYFDELYASRADEIARCAVRGELPRCAFASYAEDFRFIDDDGISVVVPAPEIEGLLSALRAGVPVSRRRLQPFAASVSRGELSALLDAGAVRVYDGVCVLESALCYDKDTGITATAGEAVFL